MLHGRWGGQKVPASGCGTTRIGGDQGVEPPHRRTLFQLPVPLRAIRSIFSTCNALCKDVFRHYPMFRHRSATPAGVTGNGGVRSLGNNATSIYGSAVNARANTATASITAV